MHKSWEGGGELVLCFYKTSLEKSENTHTQARRSRLALPLGLWNREGLAGREQFFAFGGWNQWIQKQNSKNTEKE